MKFSCGPTREEKRAAKCEWHRWFAWYPVQIDERECRWWEYVERRGMYFVGWDPFWIWEYRAIDKQ